jgi:hypothetical protein
VRSENTLFVLSENGILLLYLRVYSSQFKLLVSFLVPVTDVSQSVVGNIHKSVQLPSIYVLLVQEGNFF